MKKSTILFLFLKLYRLIWWIALPILRRESRLRQGIRERTSSDHLHQADIWIQGASAGESYLAVELVRNLKFEQPAKILLTSTTAQGLGVYQEAMLPHLSDQKIFDSNLFHNRSRTFSPISSGHISINIAWFPFDIPDIMESALFRVKPSIIVLLETELWPSLMIAARKHGVRTVVINGRLSTRSFKNYMKTRWLWQQIPPDTILAISRRDAERFRSLFPCSRVDLMSNMKFDTIFARPEIEAASEIKLREIVPANIPLSILASVRREEESDVMIILDELMRRFPEQVVCLFPRHMQRVPFWKRALAGTDHRWVLRSDMEQPPTPGEKRAFLGTVILWDIFGELKSAYSIATVAFVGGSLKPLGGQNFIESVISGAATVTGPFVDDFAWVGEEIFTSNMVRRAASRDGVIEFMVSTLKDPPDRRELIKKGVEYLRTKQGGTSIACNVIKHYMSE